MKEKTLWIARDKDGSLNLFRIEPIRDEVLGWFKGYCYADIIGHFSKKDFPPSLGRTPHSKLNLN